MNQVHKTKTYNIVGVNESDGGVVYQLVDGNGDTLGNLFRVTKDMTLQPLSVANPTTNDISVDAAGKMIVTY